jgi:glucosylceramidase
MNKTKYFCLFLVASILIVGCKNQASVKTVKKKLTKAEVYLTAKGTSNLLSKQIASDFFDFPQPSESFPSVIVDYHKTFQNIEGIGGALTDASAETFYKLPKEKQDEFITAYFDADKGIGYTLGRTHINSCDFSSESYAYTETPGDTALAAFSIEHDLKFRIPFIKLALQKAGNGFKLYASPWSPPAWMKTNNDMLHGGKLKPQYYSSWADYYIRFFEEYRKKGISFWGLTVQNEPMATQTWESCIYTAEEEKILVRDYLGPKLAKSKFKDTRLIIWDHNRDIMYQRAADILNDPEAAKYVWGTGFHWYSGKQYGNEQSVHEAFPDKSLLFTEGCAYPFNFDSINNWHFGEEYGESMINDFNNWASGWTDWNILLNETGGPNHVGNFCYAPIIADTRKGELIYMSSYYYMGHFSKFVRPGAKRIICTTSTNNLLATAFLNTDESVVVVVMNQSATNIDFNLCIDGKAAKLSTPAHSIITSVIP